MNDHVPFFSVIIPTYNRGKMILKTIDSVLNQLEQDFEILVVDDGSTDETKELIKPLKDKRLRYFFKENGERGAARNFGIKQALGHYVTFLDSDDLFYNDHLQVARSFIENNDTKVFFQQFEFTNEKGTKSPNFEPSARVLNDLLVKKGNFFACMGVFARREVLLENLFNEDRNLAGSEDYELWLRLAARYPIHYSDKVTSTLIFHEGRSVINVDKNQLIKRKELMLRYLFDDSMFAAKYGSHKSQIYADAYSYISLHLVLAKHYSEGLQFLLKSLGKSARTLFTKRTMAILKRLIIRT